MAPFTAWVIVETSESGLRDSALEALGEGRALADGLAGRVHAVLLGNPSPSQVEQTTRQDVDAIYLLEHPLLAKPSPDGWVSALTGLFTGAAPGLILFSASPLGQETAGRLAIRLGAPVVNECVWIKPGPARDILLVKPTHAGKFQTTYSSPSNATIVASLQPGVVGSAPPIRARQPEMNQPPVNIAPEDLRTRQVALIPGDPRKMDLSEAERIVAGGGGAQDTEAWQILESLGEALDAPVGGSRVAMDAGRVPRSRMIGQSGQSVKPRLYIAAGISGASHHLNGVQAEHLIAINTDRSAGIFQKASLGVVGDLKEILGKLAERIRKNRPARPTGGPQ